MPMKKELVEVFEPFEEATDILQGDKYKSISLVLSCFLDLKHHLSQHSTRHSSQVIRALQASFDHWLGHAPGEPLYICMWCHSRSLIQVNMVHRN